MLLRLYPELNFSSTVEYAGRCVIIKMGKGDMLWFICVFLKAGWDFLNITRD